MSDEDLLAPKARVNWRRLVAAGIVLIIAAVIGIMGALGNWFSFALGEVTTTPPAVQGDPSPSPSAFVSPSILPSPTPPGDSAFKEGRAAGFEQGFQDGREQGRKDGGKRGLDRGIATGKKKGFDLGYARGYKAGYAAGFAKTYRCDRPKRFCQSI